jgi:hypothetical protein
MKPQILKLIDFFFLNALLIIHTCEIYIFDHVTQN